MESANEMMTHASQQTIERVFNALPDTDFVMDDIAESLGVSKSTVSRALYFLVQTKRVRRMDRERVRNRDTHQVYDIDRKDRRREETLVIRLPSAFRKQPNES